MAQQEPPQDKRRRHARVDNVIYANFGAKTTVRTEPEAPEIVESRNFSPVALRIRNLATQEADAGRLKRGRDYARSGHVLNVKFGNSLITADVAGSQNLPFQVSIAFPYLSTDGLSQITQYIAASPDGLNAARHGQLSEDILDLLLGTQVTFRCDCPDHVVCCKHSVAVVTVASEKVEADPLLAFRLRGLDLAQLEQAVTMQARAASTQDLKERFWQGRDLPSLPEPKIAPALDDSDASLLHKAMRLVSYTNIDELRAVSDIEDIYYHLTHEKG
ncbi:SWIM zinc finger family protein [Corynebacterium diphtheriae]|uniref:SWIM zinc finger family protein n=1 Tax=Corynebacterium diphtheriae TaxID=1717 RepID=UPI000245AED0|nr:hypothetical protein [Corynebacterium diphtheriae]OWN11584.1 hypothetical protein AY479_00760 [Corynebacterium belfantii]AEX48524.1 hypothetical protein CDBH8_1001 [Corynebacterium diphtheriae BH8]AEX71923.1 hypothetical protein CDCE8392_0930 [Corynebacterium diphtheriae CDCE 8392]KLN40846.1 hypothetical protein AL07_04815 [Corynebacterium diphtheriae bv. gravis str. ISS 4060]MBG9262733.1 hypothetical protein [Corynebacterium diphtheriae bv. gravis]